MFIKKIAGIAAAACIAANAYALPPNAVLDIPVINLSGASAQDEGIEALFGTLCLPGTLDIYRDNGANPGSAYRAFSCQLDSAQVSTPPLTNPNIMVRKRSAGGSGQGVNPLTDNLPGGPVKTIDFMIVSAANCVTNGPGEWLCSATGAGLQQAKPTAGVSDVDPGMFRGVNTPANTLPVNPAVLSGLTIKPAAALVFGIPVTLGLRNALQEVQINAGLVPVGCIGSETIDCMPSLTSAEVASIMSGQISSWSKFIVPNSGGSLVPFTSAVATPPGSPLVAICRRVDGSGTQATTNANFLDNPCTSSAPTPVNASVFGGPTVVLNSGSGNVENCLEDFNDGTNTAGGNPASRTFWAVGVQSLEKNADLAFNYRFVKIDGVAPILENVYNGSYKDWSEQSFQWRAPGQPDVPNTNQLAILNTLSTLAGSPATLGSIDAAQFTHSFGVSGFLALTRLGNSLAANAVFNPLLPITPYTHAPSGSSLDNCRTPVIDRTISQFPSFGF